MNIFMEASRQALRFDGEAHSNLTTEQLWALPLQTTRGAQSSLDGVGKIIMRLLRENDEESLVKTSNPINEQLKLKLEVVKAIIEYKQAENANKIGKAAAASEAQQLEAILETKKATELQNLPVEEIEKRLAAAKAKAHG